MVFDGERISACTSTRKAWTWAPKPCRYRAAGRPGRRPPTGLQRPMVPSGGPRHAVLPTRWQRSILGRVHPLGTVATKQNDSFCGASRPPCHPCGLHGLRWLEACFLPRRPGMACWLGTRKVRHPSPAAAFRLFILTEDGTYESPSFRRADQGSRRPTLPSALLPIGHPRPCARPIRKLRQAQPWIHWLTPSSFSSRRRPRARSPPIPQPARQPSMAHLPRVAAPSIC